MRMSAKPPPAYSENDGSRIVLHSLLLKPLNSKKARKRDQQIKLLIHRLTHFWNFWSVSMLSTQEAKMVLLSQQ